MGSLHSMWSPLPVGSVSLPGLSTVVKHVTTLFNQS